MPTKKYRKGSDKERWLLVKRANDLGYSGRTMTELNKNGEVIVIRSAGSHSPIDCIIIDHQKRCIELIQAKGTMGIHHSYIDPKLKKKLENALKPMLDGSYSVLFKAL